MSGSTGPAGAELRIGQRVQDADGYRGSVRYIGPVVTSKSADTEWVGVEWDDGSRGKHDGSVTTKAGEVVRYFTTAEGRGSFLKRNKVDCGVSFFGALRQRYVEMDAPLEAPNNVFEGAYANTNKEGGRKAIEFVGELKVRERQQIAVLDKCTLRACGIARARDPEETPPAAAARYTEVDLQGNLLREWADVAELVDAMPQLRTLHLNGNLLAPLGADSLRGAGVRRLRTLVLNNCGLEGGATLRRVLDAASCLEELYAAGNCFADLGEALDGLSSGGELRVLDVSACEVPQWSQLLPLRRLPRLQVLSANDNPGIRLAGGGAAPGEWPCLASLGLSGTGVENWSSIDSLNSMAALRGLRLQRVPLLRGLGQSEARALVIGRVRELVQLNGSIISRRERAEAEKTYLRSIWRRSGGPDGDRETRSAAAAEHPRMAELEEKWAEVMAPTSAETGATSLKSQMVSVTIVPVAASASSLEPVQKKVPLNLQVLRLKQLARRLFGLDVDRQALAFRHAEDRDAPPTAIDDDTATLAYFGVAEGARIFVNEAA